MDRNGFLIASLTGVVLAAVYDAHRAWRAVVRPRGLRAHLMDAALLPAAALVLGVGLLAATWGALRAYFLLGVVIGAWLYLRLASPVLLRTEIAVVGGVFAAARAAARIVTWPARAGLALGRRTAGVAARLIHRR